MKSHRSKSALTREDVAWLEQRLSSAMVPVQPRAQFIQDAKRAMLDGIGDMDDETPATPWVALLSGVLFAAGLVLLFVALARRRT